MNSSPPRPVRVAFLLFLVSLFYFSTFNIGWGYDEFGAVITHLELDNPAFVKEYINVYRQICGECSGAFDVVFQNLVLPLFVVPFRWTYAIGFSPLLGLARWLELDWHSLKPLLLLPNIVGSGFGLWLTLRAVAGRGFGTVAQVGFLALIAASSPLMYWVNSFSSYSNHLLCFGLLLYATLVSDEQSRNRFFGRGAVMRAVTPLLNYQYAPVVAAMGFVDFIRHPRGFISERRWVRWLLPALMCVVSALFLLLRARVSGKHSSPTFAALSAEEAQAFSFPDQVSDFGSFVKTLTSRYLDIIYSFYLPDTVRFTSLSVPEALFGLLVVVSFAVIAWRRLDRATLVALGAMCLGTLTLQFVGLMPMSPLRHQLVLLPPIALFIACLIERLIVLNTRRASANVVAVIFLLFTSALLYQVYYFARSPENMPAREVRDALVAYDVDRLVLAPCELEPVLYPDLRQLYSPVYRCGPRVVERLPSDVRVIAVWSRGELTPEMAKTVVADYSDKSWIFSQNVLPVSVVGSRSNLYIGRRFEARLGETEVP